VPPEAPFANFFGHLLASWKQKRRSTPSEDAKDLAMFVAGIKKKNLPTEYQAA